MNLLITIDKDIPKKEADAILAEVSIIKTYKQLARTYLVDGDLQSLKSNPSVLTVDEPNTEFQINGAAKVKALDASMWYFGRLLFEYYPPRTSYTCTNEGEHSIIYLMDSGVSTKHDELQHANITHLYNTKSTPNTDDIGHGTFLAGIIAGKTRGIAPQADIRSVKLFNKESKTNLVEYIEAIDAVMADHLPTRDVTKIVNMSFVTDSNELVNLKVREMMRNNLLVICSAGNEGNNALTHSPACVPEVLTIGASDEIDRVCDFSNYNGNQVFGQGLGVVCPNDVVDLFAPGAKIKGVKYDTINELVEWSGTSISSAIAAAVAALYLTNDPLSSAYRVKELMLDDSYKNAVMPPMGTEKDFSNTPMNMLALKFHTEQALFYNATMMGVYAPGHDITILIRLSVPADSCTVEKASDDFPEWLNLVETTEESTKHYYLRGTVPEDVQVGLFEFKLRVDQGVIDFEKDFQIRIVPKETFDNNATTSTMSHKYLSLQRLIK